MRPYPLSLDLGFHWPLDLTPLMDHLYLKLADLAHWIIQGTQTASVQVFQAYLAPTWGYWELSEKPLELLNQFLKWLDYSLAGQVKVDLEYQFHHLPVGYYPSLIDLRTVPQK